MKSAPFELRLIKGCDVFLKKFSILIEIILSPLPLSSPVLLRCLGLYALSYSVFYCCPQRQDAHSDSKYLYYMVLFKHFLNQLLLLSLYNDISFVVIVDNWSRDHVRPKFLPRRTTL